MFASRQHAVWALELVGTVVVQARFDRRTVVASPDTSPAMAVGWVLALERAPVPFPSPAVG
ncbi:MAG TPA: hypothetical protein VH593_07320 [Ktedonobacteraceae bacterium]